ncbi:MAG TPA: NIPSNAP family containing protein, partial [Clostridia bacterium]|nr:NIPSNAP family containing protein [Clostridia bacterium]
MKRREFLKASLAVSSLAGLSTASFSASAAGLGGKKQEYYELRAYRLKSGAKADLLDNYLEKVAIPVWNRYGSKTVGVFKEREPKDT